MLRLLLAITFGFMTLWHGPAMALSAFNAATGHHSSAAGAPADHRRHQPATPSDSAAPCPVLSCCLAPAPATTVTAIALSPSVLLRCHPGSPILADDPAPPVPPPRPAA